MSAYNGKYSGEYQILGYDFAFVDAEKRLYHKYYELLLELVARVGRSDSEGAPRMDMASFGLAHQLATAVWRPPAFPVLRPRVPDLVLPPVSPRYSPPPSEEWLRRGQMRPDLTAACLAFDEADLEEVVAPHAASKGKGGVPVFVMLPLDSVRPNHEVNRRKAMNASLMARVIINNNKLGDFVSPVQLPCRSIGKRQFQEISTFRSVPGTKGTLTRRPGPYPLEFPAIFRPHKM
ncbi:hypothetical protein EJ110_NYTH03595 [Nymphaea thermarum]|nr:hypothetical protein EJ110_NYTH03595 [Nymphaea thermarum]